MWGFLLVIVVSAVACGLVVLMDKLIPADRREVDAEAIGFVFAIVGVLYAIVLAFVVIDVWTKMTEAEANVFREANALVEEYRYAQSLPDAQRLEIQRISQDYATQVIQSEWPQMRRHERVGLDGYALLDQLRAAVDQSRPNAADSEAAQLAYSNAVAQSATLAEAREMRIAAASAGVPSVLWFVLLGGGALVVGFAYIFNISSMITRMVLAIGLTVMTVLLLWCIFQMEFPFARQLSIGSDAFEFAIMRFTQIGQGG